MRDYETEAREAELRGQAQALRIRADGLLARANKRQDTANAMRRDAYVRNAVAKGQMCPGGCDTAVGGCRKHADSC